MDTVTFTERFAQLNALGGVRLSGAFVGAQKDVSATNHILGQALLSAEHGDTTQFLKYALDAQELAPEDAAVLRTLALAHSANNDQASAFRAAQDAVLNDKTARAWEVLGILHLEGGRLVEAEDAFRAALGRDNESYLGARGLAMARWQRADQATALGYFAKAFSINPRDPTLLNLVVKMYAQSGWPISATSMLGFIRSYDESADKDLNLFLDLAELRLLEEVLKTFPWSDSVNNREPLLKRVLTAQKSISSTRRVAVSYVLTNEMSYWDVAKSCLDGIDMGELPDDVRSRAHFVFGRIADNKGDTAAALEHYTIAVKLNGERWDAGCNALQLLLEAPGADAYAKIANILGCIPERVRLANPKLMINEAVYNAHIGHTTTAINMLQSVVERSKDEEAVKLAQDALHSLTTT